MWHNRNGDPITNSAGQLPLKPNFKEFAVNVWEFQVFKPGYTNAMNKNEHNAINSTAWQGYEPFQAWISEIHSSGRSFYGVPPTEGEDLTYVIRLIDRYNGWKCQHPDVGWDYLDGDELKRFTNDTGSEYIGKLTDTGDSATATGDLLIKLEEVNNEINFTSVLGI